MAPRFLILDIKLNWLCSALGYWFNACSLCSPTFHFAYQDTAMLMTRNPPLGVLLLALQRLAMGPPVLP